MATQSTIKDGVLGNNSVLSTSGEILTYDEWLLENESRLTGKNPEEKRKLYQDYLKGVNGRGSTSSSITPQLTDNTGNQPTELNQTKPTSNIDLMGTTDVLTQVGIATGNSTLTKAGILGNSAVRAIKGIQATKGLKGINKTAGVTGAVGGFADAADQMLFGDQVAKNSALTNGINSVYDTASSAIMTMGPYGALIGGAMKVGGLLSDGLTALGVGTDQMTTTDKILDSKFLKLTPLGLVNGIFSSTSDRFTVDNNVRAKIGSSYGGAYAFMDDAASKAGKEYGLFSSGARDDANEQIGRAKVMQSKIGNIQKNASDRRSIVANSNELLSTNYMYNLAGGLDQRYLRAAKEGGKLDRIKKIDFNKKGGQLHQVIDVETKTIEWRPVLEEDWEPDFFQKGGKTKRKKLPYIKWLLGLKQKGVADPLYDYKRAYEIFSDEDLMNHYDDPNKYHLKSVSDREENGMYPFLKLGTRGENPELEGEFEWQQTPEGKEFMKHHDIIFKDGRYWYIPLHKDGGKTPESEEEPLSNQQNVIPEGALHARKHHMENTEGLTQKGIPVIDNNGDQQAEIELNEIIFNLEVTQKLEELCKDGSDEAAIEAGKLLVQEILFNTEDRTGLISTLKEGGKLGWQPQLI